MPKLTAAQRLATAAKRGFAVPGTDGLRRERNTSRLNHKFSTRDEIRKMMVHFDKFLDDMKSSDNLDIFASSPSSSDDVFAKGSPAINFASITAFLEFLAQGSDSGLGTGRNGGLRGVHLSFACLSLHWHRRTGMKLDETLSRQITAWIDSDLAPRHGLYHAVRERVWLDEPEFKEICRTFLAPDFSIWSVRARWQMLALSGVCWNESLRVGAVIPRNASEDTGKKWGQLRGLILPRKGGGENIIAVEDTTISGKTSTSDDLLMVGTEDSSGRWLDTSLMYLLIANTAGAFPPDWTIEEMLDPKLFADGSRTSIEFAFGNPGAPVFIANPMAPKVKGEERQQQYLAMSYQLSKAARQTGIDKPVSWHVCRRSGAVAEKRRGGTIDDLTGRLRSTVASGSFDTYTKDVIAADATKAVYGIESDHKRLMEHHPTRAKINPNLRPKAFPKDIKRKVLFDTQYLEAVSDYDEAVAQCCKEHDVSSPGQLPLEVKKATVMPLYDLCQRTYNRLLACYAVEAAYVADISQFLPQPSPVPAASSSSSLPQGSDKSAQRPTRSAGRMTDQQNILEDESAVFVNEYPSPEAAEYNLEAVHDVLYNEDLTNSSDMLNTCFETGLITSHDYTTARVNLGLTERDDTSIPEVSSAKDSDSAGQQGDDALIETAHVAAGPSSSRQAPPNVEEDEEEEEPASGEEGPEEKVEAGTSLDENEDDSGDPFDFSILERASDVLFNRTDASYLEAFNICASIPNDDILLFGYRIGHVPIDDECPFCGHPLANFCREVEPFGKNWRVKKLELRRTHMYACARAVAETDFASELEKTYPSHVERSPVTGKGPRKSQFFKGATTWSIMHLAVTLRKSFNLLRAGVRNGKITEPTLPCKLCDDHPRFLAFGPLCDHLLAKHNILLPWIKFQKGEHAAAAALMPLGDVRELRYEARFYVADGSYHNDPLEAYHFAEHLRQQRLIDDTNNVAAYGVNPAFVYPDYSDSSLGLDFDLAADHNGQPSDSKYSRVNGRYGNALVDGLCIICAHDPAKPMRDRMRAFNNLRHEQTKHSLKCLRATFQMCKEHDLAVGPPHYMQSGTGFICPDAVCIRNNRFLASRLELVHHLVAVHDFQFMGNHPSKSLLPVNITDNAFANEDELLEFFDLETRRNGAGKPKPKKGKAGASAAISTATGALGEDALEHEDPSSKATSSKASSSKAVSSKGKGKGKASAILAREDDEMEPLSSVTKGKAKAPAKDLGGFDDSEPLVEGHSTGPSILADEHQHAGEPSVPLRKGKKRSAASLDADLGVGTSSGAIESNRRKSY